MPTSLLPRAAAQQSSTDVATYMRPPEAIASIIEAKPNPSIGLDPTSTYMTLHEREAMPPLADLAAPMWRLAGRRLNPDTNAPHAPRAFTAVSIRRVDADPQSPGTKLTLPDASTGVSIGRPVFSLDGSRFAVPLTFRDRIEIWIGESEAALATGSVRKLHIGAKLNAASGSVMRWLPDNRTLLVRTVPASRGERPVEPLVPVGPVVQETAGKKAQVRTFQDLLKNSHDEQLFDWIMSTQLMLIDVSTQQSRALGTPDIWTSLDLSPDGNYLLASRIARPYSYLVPLSQFGEVEEVLSMTTGEVVKTLRQVGLRDQIPIEGVETGPRDYFWNDLAPAQLLYALALDEGDPRNKVPQRDAIYVWDAPFTSEPRELLRTTHRFSGMSMLQQGPWGQQLAMVSEYDRDRKWSSTSLFDLGSPSDTKVQGSPRLMRDLSINERYNDPGNPLSHVLPNGRSVVRVDDGKLWLSGEGASPSGDRPFLDREALADFSKQRIWQSDASSFEQLVDLTDDASRIITLFQSPTDFPNYFSRALAPNASGTLVATDRAPMTAFVDPVPQVREVKKELIKYTRADGVELSATLYLPPGYDKDRDGPLPLFLWAYPLEYTDKATAGQVSAAPTTFTRMGGSSHLCLVFAGYAVMDEATMPVVGDPETVNDTFVEQIVSSAKAAIDKAAELGVGDPKRVAVGGHSYGAFMTANLLAHSDLFKAGVARSGAYNRTLTPFGFQGERRTYWEATDTYTKMSPFTFAGNIKTPLLLIHGQIDNNPGTFPVQSERLFAAIKGLGGTARLVMLPFESHGYAAMESALHVQAETIAWLDKHVKN
jgi:dipeptidyl aminopeptidase/acylaminoacyl peptidase